MQIYSVICQGQEEAFVGLLGFDWWLAMQWEITRRNIVNDELALGFEQGCAQVFQPRKIEMMEQTMRERTVQIHGTINAFLSPKISTKAKFEMQCLAWTERDARRKVRPKRYRGR